MQKIILPRKGCCCQLWVIPSRIFVIGVNVWLWDVSWIASEIGIRLFMLIPRSYDSVIDLSVLKLVVPCVQDLLVFSSSFFCSINKFFTDFQDRVCPFNSHFDQLRVENRPNFFWFKSYKNWHLQIDSIVAQKIKFHWNGVKITPDSLRVKAKKLILYVP